ncbi:MAG: S-layer homology domain-containing protein [bacterium]|nr:S-layer homology domain-containing protein [bacterium]
MTIKHIAPILGTILGLGILAPAWAAPLFPDVPENIWARDAVATLAAKGLVEGYPDGTFKGDRQASRWETALVVARLLSQLENQHASLATKAELAELQKLAQSLQEELQALGVRTAILEKKVDKLDARVSELERITFYGEYNARIYTSSLRNTGLGSLGNPAIIEYNDAVGTNTGAGGIIPAPSAAAGFTFNTFMFGVTSVTDWSTGRPMVSGTSIGQSLMLGTNLRISDDIDCGAEFSAYSSCGNNVIDAFWGVPQPYLSNPFTATIGTKNNPQGLDHTPYVKMALDHFWIHHKPSNITLTVGSFKDQNFSPMVYVPERNPNAWGDYFLNSYGVQLKGDHKISDKWNFKWEAMGTRLANGFLNSLFDQDSYHSRAGGFNVDFSYNEGQGNFKANLLHVVDGPSETGNVALGLHFQDNFTLNWVNPNGYYINQLGVGTESVAGMGSTTDRRPIPMVAAAGNDGITGIAGVPNLGGIGAQDMLNYGFSADYEFDLKGVKPKIYADYAHTNYKPSKNSSYSVGGNAWRAGLDFTTLNDTLTIGGKYVSTDPTFDPFILNYPAINGISNTLWNVPGFNYYNSMYSLHDVQQFTHNRKGWMAKLDWRFCRTGKITAEYKSLEQTKTSCQDVRYSANSIAAGTPNTTVLGFSPGFMDPVFHGFSAETFAPDGNGNDLGTVLENPRGKATNWSVSAGFKYPLEPKKNKRCVGISGGARSTHFTRHSQLSSLLTTPTRFGSESQNYVNFYLDAWAANISYDITTDWHLNVGYKSIDLYGHLDPLGVMCNYANTIGSSDFDIIDMEQRIPNISINWDINDHMSWGAMGEFFTTHDRMKEDIFASPGIPAMNISFGPQQGAHPFNWQGYMFTTHMNFKF